jgi:hypothetical protein
MGIYVIKSKFTNWYKIGHHKITEKRPNVYYRFIRRGFFSCISPIEIQNRLSFDDVELLFWFPNLNEKDEKHLHILLSNTLQKYGEWFKTDNSNIILNCIQNVGGVLEIVLQESLDEAKNGLQLKSLSSSLSICFNMLSI